MRLIDVSPETDIPFVQRSIAAKVELSDLQGSLTGIFALADLAPGEFVQSISAWTQNLPASPGLTAMGMAAGVHDKGTINYHSLLLVTDVLTIVGTNPMFGGILPNITISQTIKPFIDTITYTALTDSVMGTCTPNAATSSTSSNVTETTGVQIDSAYMTDDFLGLNGGTELFAAFVPSGDVLANLTAGDFWFYINTLKVPASAIG